MCVLLRNRFQEIRDVARGTLVKILETLGCRYLQYLLKEMHSVLVKGYQVWAHAEIKIWKNTHSGSRAISYVVMNSCKKRMCQHFCWLYAPLYPGSCADIHSASVTVNTRSNPEEWWPGPMYDHAHWCKNVWHHKSTQTPLCLIIKTT